MITKNDFQNISIRGRVAFGIRCVENAIHHYRLTDLDWDFLLNLLWSYTNSNVGRWHELMSECTPKSILEDEFVPEEMELLNENKFNELKDLYSKSNEVINEMIYLLFWIGKQDLYASVVHGSPITLGYIQEIIDLMNNNKIPLPDIKKLEKFPISENYGWGREFTRDDIFNDVL